MLEGKHGMDAWHVCVGGWVGGLLAWQLSCGWVTKRFEH